MDAGGHAQNPNFAAGQLGMAGAGLASRRGGQNIKPLSFDALKSPVDKEGVPTPRTSRSHLLAGLRTAPKTAAGTTFPASPTSMAPSAQMFGRNNVSGNGFANAQSYYHTAPKTAMPQFGNSYNHNLMGLSQQYTTEQVLAPPQIRIGDHEQEQLDPNYLAELVATNAYLAEQQQQLQQQLASVQAAASQFSGMNLNHGRPQPAQLQQQLQQQLAYQQAHLRNMQQQQQLMAASAAAQPNIYAYVDPATGQPTYFVDQSAAQLQNNYMMQQAQAYQQMQQATGSPAPRVQVSPPPEAHSSPFRSNSPPKRYDSPAEPAPLPPPSANAFRRGHKKASSLAINSALAPTTGQEPLKSAGPKTAAFPLTPMTGGYGPGQARAGEHPIRQPRGPPSFDELASKPTAKHEGSKNFATRTRRSAVHNLVRAGMERRKGTGSSNGSMSPVSESAEESATPITDNESDSGRSGSGSLSGEMEDSLPSSCTLALGGWGAIGSDRPSSRQKARKSVDSVSSATSGCESDVDNSFASVFKNGAQRTTKAVDVDGQRKGQMLVLTSADKRRGSPMAV